MKSRRQVEAAVEEFNKYRIPEAVAKIVEVNEDRSTIEFSGPFCVSCGVEDYFDDLRIELEKNIGEKIEAARKLKATSSRFAKNLYNSEHARLDFLERCTPLGYLPP
jgi:hypothetical protein